MGLKKVRKKVLAASRIVKKEGLTTLAIKSLQKVQDRSASTTHEKHKIQFLVDYSDVIAADWSIKTASPSPINKTSYTINWVMSPPGKGSGGHQNLFRFIRYTEQAGHICRIYLYSTIDKRTVAEIKEILKDSYDKTKASIEWLDGEMAQADAIFATGWETAYPVFNSILTCQRFYFVQDFEPYFYPVGSEYILAENTYRFGFYGTTAGGWLAQKLKQDYGMQTSHFDFGADTSLYAHKNDTKRNEIFFYARPVTARRGFELGIMALDLFHQQHPEYVINLAGWDVSDYDIPFPHNNLKTLSLEDLPALYNRCAAALVMSLTNMSLLPLELLSCGTIPVVNDGENNRLVSDNPFIAYVSNNPASLAKELARIVGSNNLPEHARKASASAGKQNWDDSGAMFVKIVEEKLRRV